jgi:hypothetical protein
MAVSTHRAERFELDQRTRVIEVPSPANHGFWSGVVLAGWIGWISVPNALIADTSFESHVRLAISSMLAVGIWSYNLAQRALDRPGSAAVRLAIGIYATSWLTVPLCSVPLIALPTTSGLAPTSLLGVFLAPVPWVVAMSVVWAYAFSFGWPVLTATYPRSIRRRFALSLNENNRAARIASVTFAVLLVSGFVGIPDGRHIGWQVAQKPSAHRPAVANVITLVDTSAANGDTVVSLTDGRSFRLPASAALGRRAVQQGDLLVSATDPATWWDALPESFHGGDALGSDFAWDTGDAILFPDGLELPKASDLNTNGIAPAHAFGEKVYTLGRCAEIRVNTAAEVTWLGSVCG